MSDFAKFCPKCYAFFRDPDLYAKHVEVCGVAKKDAGKKTADGRPQTAAEVKKTRSRQTATERSQEQGVRSQNAENKEEQNGIESETPDSCILTPDSSPKSPKFKT